MIDPKDTPAFRYFSREELEVIAELLEASKVATKDLMAALTSDAGPVRAPLLRRAQTVREVVFKVETLRRCA